MLNLDTQLTMWIYALVILKLKFLNDYNTKFIPISWLNKNSDYYNNGDWLNLCEAKMMPTTEDKEWVKYDEPYELWYEANLR